MLQDNANYLLYVLNKILRSYYIVVGDRPALCSSVACKNSKTFGRRETVHACLKGLNVFRRTCIVFWLESSSWIRGGTGGSVALLREPE